LNECPVTQLKKINSKSAAAENKKIWLKLVIPCWTIVILSSQRHFISPSISQKVDPNARQKWANPSSKSGISGPLDYLQLGPLAD